MISVEHWKLIYLYSMPKTASQRYKKTEIKDKLMKWKGNKKSWMNKRTNRVIEQKLFDETKKLTRRKQNKL